MCIDLCSLYSHRLDFAMIGDIDFDIGIGRYSTIKFDGCRRDWRRYSMVWMTAESGMAAESWGGVNGWKGKQKCDCSTYLFLLGYPHAYVDFSMS